MIRHKVPEREIEYALEDALVDIELADGHIDVLATAGRSTSAARRARPKAHSSARAEQGTLFTRTKSVGEWEVAGYT